MKLDARNKKNNYTVLIKNRWATLTYFILGFSALVLLILTLYRNEIKGYFTSMGIHSKQELILSASSVYPLLKEKILKKSLPPQKVWIDVKFKNYKKLYEQRANALKEGVLRKKDKVYIPGSLRFGGNDIKVKLRLKGDWTDHLKTDKWSFRIKTKGKKHFRGMRRFSLQAPSTRYFIKEKIFHTALAEEGLLNLQYDFVHLYFNGKDLGLMAIEEHFSKELLERQKRKEGVILKLDESYLWHNRKPFQDWKTVYINPMTALIKAFNQKKISKNSKLHGQYKLAVSLFRGFLDGRLKAEQVFDSVMIAKFMAICEIFDASHALDWRNMRFYLNPYTLKLEPIGYDAMIGELHGYSIYTHFYSEVLPLTKLILKSPKIRREFVKQIRHLSEKILQGDLIEKLKKVERKDALMLFGEYPLLPKFNFNLIKEKAEKYKAISLVDNRFVFNEVIDYPTLINAFIYKEKNHFFIELLNTVPHSVQITKISRVSKDSLKKPQYLLNENQEIKLAASPKMSVPYRKRIKLAESFEFSKEDNIVILSKILNSKKVFKNIAIRYSPPFVLNKFTELSPGEITRLYPFLKLDEANKMFKVHSCSVQIDTSIVLPSGYGLEILEGVHLQFSPKSYLMIQEAHFKSIGTKGKPNIFSGINGGNWQGILVRNATQESFIKHSKIYNTNGIDTPLLKLSSGVSFYKSPVRIENSSFIGNRTEDAINVIRTSFNFKNILIKDASSDGFDGDFVEGEIVDSQFEKIGFKGGGDGIDFSGSNITVKNLKFSEISDKAISAGEQTTINGENIRILNTTTGIAVKDKSKATFKKLSFNDISHAAVMAYNKKKEYGPGRVNISEATFSKVEKKAIAQDNSVIKLNGETILTETLDVKTMYKEGVMKK